MNLPRTEFDPEEPERLPPARRRRARRLLAPMDLDERTAFLDAVAHRTSPSVDFFLLSLVGGGMMAVGLLLDAPALLVLGALMSPVMAPVVGIALGTVIGSTKFFFRSLIGFLIGSLFVLAAGVATGLVASVFMPLKLSQAHLHAQLSGGDFFVLVVGTVFMVAFITHSDRSPAVPSVAVAYALYVPLAIAGFGLASGEPGLFPGSLIVYVSYLACAILFGTITLAIMGFRPLTWFGYTLGATLTLIGIVVIVAISGFGISTNGKITFPTPRPTPTITLTPVPPTPTLTTTPIPPTVTLTPTATLVPSATPTETPTPSPTPVYARVYSPSGGGAYMRAEPGFTGKGITTLQNGTLVKMMPETRDIDGYVWVKVYRMPDGPEGWMLQSLLTVATPPPNW